MSIKAVAVLLGDVARGIIHFEQTVNDFRTITEMRENTNFRLLN